ncbi:MAG: hypothetical protein EOP84_20155 [Verrucomicrobiaceae bacterium]|nr:MAG: hypothetical protein EOP84_20155 [Verrucomicrobiaceae bacterium]
MNLESVLERTRQIIRRKHYSWNTEKVYCHWIERYSRYVLKLPRELPSEQKMERFLTCLAQSDCSASTQNQAFNAILFLYNEVLERPLGNVRALRARRKRGWSRLLLGARWHGSFRRSKAGWRNLGIIRCGSL